jgi:hypothetical protein
MINPQPLFVDQLQDLSKGLLLLLDYLPQVLLVLLLPGQ